MSEDFWGFVVIIIILLGVTFGIKSCVDHENSPEFKAKREAELKECETPVLVSEIDDVKLYVVRPNCRREVYFSKSGTHTTHTERHGKTTSTYDDDVSGESK